MSKIIFEDAQYSIRKYQKSSKSYEEKWKTDHEEAMKCMDFEAIIAFGLSIYQFLNNLDEMWRMNVLKGQMAHDKSVDDVIDKLYRAWSEPCGHLLNSLASFEKAGYEITGADKFRAACREVEGLLTTDNDFFHHDKLLELRDRAIDEHHDGKSIAELID